MTRTKFPTMADVTRDKWPVTLRVTEPHPDHLGAVPLLMCERANCYRLVPSAEMHDFREIAPAVRASLGLTHDYMCASCFHLDASHGKLLHSEVARTLGLDASVQSSLDWHDAYATQRGHIITTARTQHLHAVVLPQGIIPNPSRINTP